MNTVLTLCAVAVAGGLGSVVRVWMVRREENLRRVQRIRTKFPWGTLSANAVSCWVFGLITAGFESTWWTVALLAGFCGGLSTMASVGTALIASLREKAIARFSAMLASMFMVAAPLAVLGHACGQWWLAPV